MEIINTKTISEYNDSAMNSLHYLCVMDKKKERKKKRWRQYFNSMLNTRKVCVVVGWWSISSGKRIRKGCIYIRPHGVLLGLHQSLLQCKPNK